MNFEFNKYFGKSEFFALLAKATHTEQKEITSLYKELKTKENDTEALANTLNELSSYEFSPFSFDCHKYSVFFNAFNFNGEQEFFAYDFITDTLEQEVERDEYNEQSDTIERVTVFQAEYKKFLA